MIRILLIDAQFWFGCINGPEFLFFMIIKFSLIWFKLDFCYFKIIIIIPHDFELALNLPSNVLSLISLHLILPLVHQGFRVS